jgi:predicted acylesterase/phospholipase RssA
MPVGIVLSGGGAKGDFEIGALRAMYNRGIRPAVLAGTSVGSINAVKLAEDPSSDGPLTELEGIWFSLNNDADMYVEDPNFAKIEQATKNFLRLNWFLIGYDLFSLPRSGLLGLIGDVGDALKLGVDIGNMIGGIKAFLDGGSKSLYLLDPIRQKLAALLDPGKVASSGAVLRMATVSLESGLVRYIDQSGQFIDDKTSVPLLDATIASASIPGIFAPQKLGSENFIDGGVRDVLPIRAALDAGADQVFAVCTSRAGVDPASSFDSKTILDIASRAAAEIMPDQIESFETNPPSQPWPNNVLIIQPDFTVHDAFIIDPGLIRINAFYGYMRAAELVDFARSSADQSLLLQLMQLSTQITQLRLEIWNTEFNAAGQRTPLEQVVDPQIMPVPSPEQFLQVRELKAQLKTLLETRAGLYGTSPQISVAPLTIDFGEVPVCAQATQFVTVRNMADAGMPPNIAALWLEFEAHPWINVAAASPWSSFNYGGQFVPAATPPPPQNLPEDLQLSVAIGAGPFQVASVTALSLSPGGTATIAITMGSPAAAPGPESGTLTISSNDPSNPSVAVRLIGIFVNAPPRAVVPPRKNFGIVLVDQSRTSAIMVRNTGCGNLTVTGLSVTEPGPESVFSVDGPATPFTVPSGGAALAQLTFSPSGDQVYSGTLSVDSNGVPSPATVSLQGTGRGFVNRAQFTSPVLNLIRAQGAVQGGGGKAQVGTRANRLSRRAAASSAKPAAAPTKRASPKIRRRKIVSTKSKTPRTRRTRK